MILSAPRHGFLAIVLIAGVVRAQSSDSPVVVRFHEPKLENVQVMLPVDPTPRVRVTGRAGMMFGLQADGAQLCNGYMRTNLRIDNQNVFPNVIRAGVINPGANPGAFPLTIEYAKDALKITQILEPVPTKTKSPTGKRPLDALLIKYVVENQDKVAHTVGVRIRMDMYLVDNDGALFAAPTFPNQILDGVELKGKTLPDYVQVLQRPNLQSPGFVAHFTLKMGGGLIGPSRFLCTAHALGDNGWDLAAQRANGDSDAAIFWDPREVPPGGKLTFAMAYGKGLAVSPDTEGRIRLAFGGSFEPGKLFTIQAFVEEPLPSQVLTLELPDGMTRLEGRAIEPVPQPGPNTATSMILWKARVDKLGEHAIKIRSSSGTTQIRTVTISAK
jgi:hypothetical protein